MTFNYVNELLNLDILSCETEIGNETFDLIILDPPYNMKKDFGNDNLSNKDFLEFVSKWIEFSFRKLKKNGSIYCFMGYEYFDDVKRLLCNKFILKSEIIWQYPNAGKSWLYKRNYLAEYDKILFMVKNDDYTFNMLRNKTADSTLKRWEYVAQPNGDIEWKDLTPFLQDKWKSKENYERLGKWNIYRGKPIGNVFSIPRPTNKVETEFEKHPTQKPLKLIETFIKISSNEGDLVADFFAGSGTTLVAAKKLGRNYFGTEIDEKWYEIASNRLETTVKKRKKMY